MSHTLLNFLLKARYVTALVKGNFTLPSQEVMMQEWQKRADLIISKGLPMSHIHMLAEKEVRFKVYFYNSTNWPNTDVKLKRNVKVMSVTFQMTCNRVLIVKYARHLDSFLG